MLCTRTDDELCELFECLPEMEGIDFYFNNTPGALLKHFVFKVGVVRSPDLLGAWCELGSSIQYHLWRQLASKAAAMVLALDLWKRPAPTYAPLTFVVHEAEEPRSLRAAIYTWSSCPCGGRRVKILYRV